MGETRIELIDLSDPLFPSVVGIVKILDKVVGVIDQTYSFSILLETGLVMTFSKDTLQKTGEFILPNISSPITEYAYENSTLIVMDDLGLHIFEENASNQFAHVGFIYTSSISVI